MSQTVLPRIGRADWPYLVPPTSLGTVTVVDVRDGIEHGSYVAQAERWADSVWTAWSDHHDTVRRWASASLGRLA